LTEAVRLYLGFVRAKGNLDDLLKSREYRRRRKK
jgi:hypothetical protein